MAKKHDDLIAAMIEDGRLESLLQSTTPVALESLNTKKRRQNKGPLHYTKEEEDGKTILRCKDCEKEYSNKAAHNRHWHSTHNPDFVPFECENCGTTFSKKTNMQRHVKNKVCK